MQIVFWFLLGLTLFIYFGYPVVIFVIARLRGKEPKKEGITPFVTLIVPVHDEAEVIREKVENTLLLDY